MIINGGSRCNGRWFARHLSRADHNERVDIIGIEGLGAQNLPDAFREMEAIASGTNCKNYFYHASLNIPEYERLTREQWLQAVDRTAEELGLSGQPRIIVAHVKENREHWHIAWSRIDADSMTAISDSLTYPKHERAARAIEQEFGLEPVESVLVKDRGTPRPDRNPKDYETFRAQVSKIDPREVTKEITALWNAADSGKSFHAALTDAGYVLAKGDRRDYVLVDSAGDDHSLAKRISGFKTAEIRARMADVDKEALPSVAEARAMQRAAADSADAITPQEATPEARAEPVTANPVAPEPPASHPSHGSADADTELTRQQAAQRVGALSDVTADITPDVEKYLVERFGDRPAPELENPLHREPAPRGTPDEWEDMPRGMPADYQDAPRASMQEREDAPRGTPPDWQTMPPGQGSDRREEFTAWERLANRMRHYVLRAAELWESSGSVEPAAGGYWQDKIEAARQLVHGVKHGDAHEAMQGAARLVPESWREKVSQGLHRAADLLRNERGEVPLTDFERMAADYLADAGAGDDAYAAWPDAEPSGDTGLEPPDHDAPDMD